MYSVMVMVRTLDERLWLMNRQGKAAIVASSQGHEAAQLGAVWAMRNATSAAYFPYYRDLGMVISLGVTPKEVLLGFLAKDGETFSGARQFPLHGARPDLKLYNLSNVVSTQIPHAVGYALGCKMSGDPTITITTFGDGGASEGDFHEALNFASVHKLPIIFFCENNKYAISVPMSKQMAIVDIADRAPGYGMVGVVVDGSDIMATYLVTSEAVRRAARGEGPTLIEAKVERYLPHTSDDDDTRYRTKEEIEDAKIRDPLKLFQKYLINEGILTKELDQRFQINASREINKATDEAEAAPFPDPDDFYEHVYAR
ncbi:thiamine pyrophosphate-dependent dehydrogenase E1 component subunit alpha [Dehalococcoidia bacterium]|nr:thiamine pyrophosphate-dependent dehydrogenase E1 component subunit alpha [Dehalococcoidia bacterium]